MSLTTINGPVVPTASEGKTDSDLQTIKRYQEIVERFKKLDKPIGFLKWFGEALGLTRNGVKKLDNGKWLSDVDDLYSRIEKTFWYLDRANGWSRNLMVPRHGISERAMNRLYASVDISQDDKFEVMTPRRMTADQFESVVNWLRGQIILIDPIVAKVISVST